MFTKDKQNEYWKVKQRQSCLKNHCISITQQNIKRCYLPIGEANSCIRITQQNKKKKNN